MKSKFKPNLGVRTDLSENIRIRENQFWDNRSAQKENISNRFSKKSPKIMKILFTHSFVCSLTKFSFQYYMYCLTTTAWIEHECFPFHLIVQFFKRPPLVETRSRNFSNRNFETSDQFVLLTGAAIRAAVGADDVNDVLSQAPRIFHLKRNQLLVYS